MKLKEKNKGDIIIISAIVVCISVLTICYLVNNKPISYATSNSTTAESIKISNAEKVDLEQIINENTDIDTSTTQEIVKEEVELEYITKYVDNNDMLKGTMQVSQEGRNGTQQLILRRTYDEQGELINEEQLGATVVKSSINKVIEVGTVEKKELEKREAEKKAAENPTPNVTPASLSFDMPLNKPSGFSQEEFKKVLTDNQDKNKIFETYADYFYLAEQQYNINGIFIAAVGIHESAWGTSTIAQNKHNLFGYGAYDSNPYNGAYSFTDYSECIDLIARVFVKYYINPKGTKIYDGEVATGQYYSGNTLSAVNKKYATDPNWANGVFKHMQYLYGKK